MRPWLLRPPFLGSGRSSDFSGVVRVISTKSATDEPRRPGVVGLYLRIPMCSQSSISRKSRSADRASEDVDALALAEADDRALGRRTAADAHTGAARLALAVHGVHRGDLDVEDLLDGDLDLGLVRVGVHQERVLVEVHQAVALLAHDRADDHVAVVLVEGAHCSLSWEPLVASASTAGASPE